jgi:phasin
LRGVTVPQVASQACGPRYRTSAKVAAARYPQQQALKKECLMDTNTKTTTEATQRLRAMAEIGAKQSKEAFEKIGAATTEAAEAMTSCCSTALKGIHDYNGMLVEFTQANAKSALEFVQSLAGVKSPSEFAQVSTEHARQQLETIAEQSKQLAEFTQHVTRATAEPLKTSLAKVLSRAA